MTRHATPAAAATVATVYHVSTFGQPVNLAPYARSNVARFTVSSDGSLAPVTD